MSTMMPPTKASMYLQQQRCQERLHKQQGNESPNRL